MNHFILLGLSGILAASTVHAAESVTAFDTVIFNARVFDGERQVTEDAVAVHGSEIAAVGESAALRAQCKAPCQLIDAEGRSLVPGFHDSHSHPTSGGAMQERLIVSGSNVNSIVSALKSFAKANPSNQWILGRGWSAAGFADKYPTCHDLDRGESKRPVVLSDSDGHSAWVNSAALKAAGITRETPDPEGGTIVRDKDGNPTGILFENAMDLVYEHVPSPSEAERKKYILAGQEDLLRAGFSAFHGGGVSLEMAKTYAALENEGKLKQRAFLWFDLTAEDEHFGKLIEFARSRPKDSLVQINAFKGFIDGVVTNYTAALLEPYHDKPDTSGYSNMTQEELNTLVLRANKAGYPAAIHAIGDRGVRMCLNAFEHSKKLLDHPLMNRIEHIEALNPDDAPRFGKLNVVASMQPSHMHFGSPATYYYYPRLGPQRVKYTFAWNLLAQGGALLAFGTDFPVVSADLREGLTSAMERKFGNGVEFEPSQRVSGELALAGFTRNAAIAAGRSKDLGLIAPGYQADLTLVSGEPWTTRGAGSMSIELMMVAGKIVRD